MSAPLYARDGDRFLPSEDTRGPWSLDAQHGGAPAALIARALEAVPADTAMAVARVTVEILKPVPLTPLEVSAQVERGGRRVQLVSVTVTSGGAELCRARGWRLRVTELGDELAGGEPLPFPGPEQGVHSAPDPGPPAFHRTGMELRFVHGTFPDVGPSTVWIRLLHPVVDDETPSPLMRVMAAADFGNGVSAAVPWGRYLFVNTDLSVHLHRPAEGEWVCLDAITHAGRGGVAVAESALYDARGRIGRSLQTLLIDPLPDN